MDFQSGEFIALVDRKLAELGAPPLSQQSASFGLDAERRNRLETQLGELQVVLRAGEDPFDIDAMLTRFDALWGKAR